MLGIALPNLLASFVMAMGAFKGRPKANENLISDDGNPSDHLSLHQTETLLDSERLFINADRALQSKTEIALGSDKVGSQSRQQSEIKPIVLDEIHVHDIRTSWALSAYSLCLFYGDIRHLLNHYCNLRVQ